MFITTLIAFLPAAAAPEVATAPAILQPLDSSILALATQDEAESASEWTGSVALSAIATSGNTETESFNFDSNAELHLVRGFDDELFDTFAPALTIYSEGKVNIKSATNPTVLIGLIHACAADPTDIVLGDPAWLVQTLMRWQEYRQLGMLGGFGAVNAQGWVGFLQGQGLAVDTARCEGLVADKSMFFKIKSTSKVGDVERTITTVVRVFRANEEMYYWREE